MPLTITRRKDRKDLLIITGRIHFPDGRSLRVRQAAQSQKRKVAQEEAVELEARLVREAIHGQPRGARSFAEAIEAYLDAETRQPVEEERLRRIVRAIGRDIRLSEVNQELVNKLRRIMFEKPPANATVVRAVITPIRTVMRFVNTMGWCDLPRFNIPKQPEGGTNYLLPAEAKRLLAASAPHIKPLITFLLGTGCRMAEAIYLDWRNVDLEDAKVRLVASRVDANGQRRRATKSGKDRVAEMPPIVVEILTALAAQHPIKTDGRPVGRVFSWRTQTPRRKGRAAPLVAEYAERDYGGGHIKTAWKGAIRRAGLDPALTPHDCRHTWASWHYARHKDLLQLQQDGGWSNLTLVQRYAHRLPGGQVPAIEAFYAGSGAGHQVGTSQSA